MPKTVILIDDDQDDLDVIREAINTVDDTILCISFVFPEEALRVVTKELVFTPDYIIADINMPKVPGDVLLSKLRNTAGLESTVIAMLSTSMPTALSQKLIESGADFTLQKPTKLADYNAILKSVLGTARKSRHAIQSGADHRLTGQVGYEDLNTRELEHAQSSVYIIDYRWNYLFANTKAKEKVKGYNVVGKNITEVWRELPHYNFQPVYGMLKDYVNNRRGMELK